MAWAVNRKTSWRIGWRVDGKENWKTISKKDYPRKKDAKEYAGQLEREGEGAIDKGCLFSEYFEKFVGKKTLAPKSLNRYNDVKRYFDTFLKDKYPNSPLHRITKDGAEEFKKWMAQKGYSTSTTNYSIRCLRELWRNSFKSRANPFIQISFLKKEKRQKRLPTRDEVEKILERIKKKHFPYYAFIYLLATRGWRKNDIRCLKIKDMDIVNQKLYLFRHKDKEEDIVDLTNEDCAVLSEHIIQLKKRKRYAPQGYLFPSGHKDLWKDRPIGYDTIRKVMKQVSKALGIDKSIYPHIFRHYVITTLKDQGFSSANIKEITKHKNVKTIDDWYVHPSTEIVKKAQEVLHIDTGFLPKNTANSTAKRRVD